MVKFIEQLIFKIPCVRNCIDEWRDAEKDYQNNLKELDDKYNILYNEHEQLQKKYIDLKLKIDNTAFFYLNSEQIWALPEWSCIDGPCEYRIEHTDKNILFIYYISKLNYNRFEILDGQTIRYFRIKVIKNGEERYYWKYCP